MKERLRIGKTTSGVPYIQVFNGHGLALYAYVHRPGHETFTTVAWFGGSNMSANETGSVASLSIKALLRHVLPWTFSKEIGA